METKRTERRSPETRAVIAWLVTLAAVLVIDLLWDILCDRAPGSFITGPDWFTLALDAALLVLVPLAAAHGGQQKDGAAENGEPAPKDG